MLAAAAALALLAATMPPARAVNFSCTWNNGTANWTTTADWNNCNSTFPNNGGGNTYDAVVPVGTPQLSTAITIGNVTISGSGLWQLNTASAQATLTGGLTNGNSLQVDPNFADGGSSLTIGGTLTNNSGATVQVGTFSNNLSATATLTAANLTSSGTVTLLGNTTAGSANQAHMVVTGAAPSILTGIYNLSGNALLEFGSGAITSIGSGAQLNENGNSRVALTGSTATNSALTTLSSNAGQFQLENGATVTTNSGVNLTNSSLIRLDNNFADGGSGLTIGGTLINNSGALVQVGTPSNNLSATSTLTAANLTNSGTVTLLGNTTAGSANQAHMVVSGGAPSTLTGIYNLSGNALLEFGSGAITSIGSGAQLNENGNSRVALTGSTATNTALTTLSSNAGQLRLENGATVATNSGTSLANSNLLALDPNFADGGSSLTIGGTLTNNSGATVQIGTFSNNLSATATLAAAGLSNSGTVTLLGNTTAGSLNQAHMVVTGAAPSILTGIYNLSGNALLEFGSGAITSIGSGAQLNENGNSRAALTGSTATNSALTTLSSNAGQFQLENGATVTTNSGVNLTNSNLIRLDNNFADGGSGLTIGGTLINNSGATVQVGTPSNNLSATSTLTAANLTNSGTVTLLGNTTAGSLNQAHMVVSGAAPSTLTGTYNLSGNALLEFGSGAITSIGSGAQLNENGNSRVALTGSTATNSGLATLASNAGQFQLENGATGATNSAVNLTNSSLIRLDNNFADGGSSLTIGGTLTNNSGATVQVGTPSNNLSATSTLTAAGLSNSGTVTLLGNTTAGSANQAHMVVTAAAPPTLTGIYNLTGNALLEFGSGAITSVGSGAQLNESGNSRVALTGSTATSSALTTLSSNAGQFQLENGATVTTNSGVNLTNSSLIRLDNNFADGGSSLTIGGTLTNNSGATVQVGTPSNNLSATSTLTAANLTNSGTVTLLGNTTAGSLNQAHMVVTGGAPSTLAGIYNLSGNALLEFGSGAITSIGSGAQLNESGNSRVALTGSTATSSALTTLSSNAGQFQLENGATVTTNSGVNLTNSSLIRLDNNFADGGSALTIGGTLTNNSGATVQVGSSSNNLSATSILTAAGFSNSGTVTLLGNTSDATKTAQVTVTGAGNAYTQAAGTTSLNTNSILTAPNINVTGGTLQGKGTIAGILIVSGTGTVQAIDPSNTNNAATLTVNGSYNQTGGTFATLLHGTGPQIDVLNVSTGNGVNLNGGNLQASGITFAAGQVFNNVVTFQPGQLFGTFATLQGSGNGTSVSLGGGLTLEAIYNNAAGNITLQVVNTPASNTITWNDATGNWTTDTAKWTPTGPPVPTSDVVIGSTVNGNVTLSNDATVDSLQINAGNQLTVNGGSTLSVASVPANGANSVSVASGGTLTLGGSLNTLGTVTAAAGGTVGLSGGAIIDATLAGAGPFQTNTSGTLHAVTISNGTTFTGLNGTTTTLVETITNNGNIQINGGAGNNGFLQIGSNTTLTGAGTVFLNSVSGSGSTFLRGSNVTLTNVGNTIQGAGFIGDSGALTFINQATVNANAPSQTTLSLNQGNGGVANTGLLEATNSGTLALFNTITNTGGNITANGGTVNVNATIQGGTLNTTGGGVLQTVSTATLDNVTISPASVYTAPGSTTTTLQGAITNKGTIQANGGGGANAVLQIGNNVTLSGGGTVFLNSASGAGSTFLRGSNVTLTNTDNTIQGAGFIGDSGNLTFVNQATVNANAPSQITLSLNQGNGGVTNTGLLEASGGGTLQLFNTINNAGGNITVADATSAVQLNAATVQGGTLNNTAGGSMATVSSALLEGSTAAGAVTLNGNYTASASATTSLNGSIINHGTIQVNGAVGNAILQIGGATTLSGSGAVTMIASGGGNAFLRGSNVTLTNTNNTIQGAGNIGDSGALTLVNQATVNANASGQTLSLNLGNGGVTNTGLLEATNGGTLTLFNGIANTGANITANAGTVNVNATVTGGTLNTLGGGVMQTSSAATLDNVAISTGSTYTAAAGTNTTLLDTITNQGTFQVNGGGGNNTIVTVGNNVTLSGGGAVNMIVAAGSGSAFLRGSNVTLTNTDNTIRGAGNIGDSGALTLVNQATVNANASGQSLSLNQGNGGVTNTGLLEATNGGTLTLLNGITNTGGNITANAGTVNVNAAVTGGTLNTLGGGVMQTSSAATLDNVTVSTGSTYTAPTGSTTTLRDAITNSGTLQVNGGGGSNAFLQIGNNVSLSGGGVVTMSVASGGGGTFLRGSNQTLTNTDNTIQGTGFIGDSGQLAFVNQGTVNANVSGQPLNLNQGNGGVTNSGVLEATNGGTLGLFNNVTNSGTIHAVNGSINANGGFTGTIGTAQIDAAGTLSIGAASTVGTLAQNGTLALGANNITVSTAYTNANFGTGNSFNKRAGVTGSGQILAAGNVAQAVSGTQVSNGTTTTPTLALGNVHVGGNTSANYAIQNTGSTGPSLIGALQTNVNGGNITDPALGGTGVTPQNFGPLATGATTSPAYTVTYTPTAAGPLSGQTVHIANNFGNVTDQTMSITGAAYALASPQVTSSLTPQFNFGVVQVGQTYNDMLTLKNVQVASNAAFQEGLSASFGSPSTTFLGATGTITNLAPGGTDSSSLVVSLHPTSTGTVSGSVPLTLTSVAVAGTGLSNTDLSQSLNYSWQFSGTVVNPANPSITPTTIDFGNVRINTLQQQALSVTNVAGTPPQASLSAQISAVGPATSNNGTISLLAPGATNNTGLIAGLSTANAGAQSGTATVALQSDSTPNGCTTNCIVNLAPQNVSVQGNVFRLATGSAATPVNIGNVHVGATLSGNLSVTNKAANDGFSENLNAAISGTSGQIAGSSGNVVALAPQQTNGNTLNVTLDSTTAGAKSGTATVQFQSNGIGLDGGAPINNGSQNVTVSGGVYALASPQVTSSLTPQFNFGVVQVGQTLTDPLTIKNVQVASNAAFQEGLSASFGSPSTNFLTANGTITNLAPGATDNSSLVVSLTPTGTGTVSGSVPLTLTSVAVAGTGLSNTDLSQTLNYNWTFSGTVVNPADPSITPTTKDFGNVRINTLQQQALSVTNVAGTPPQASLSAQISAVGPATSNNGTISLLAPGATNNTNLIAGLDTSAAGARSGTATVALQSDSTPNGCTTNCIVNLAPQNVSVQGSVFRLATGSAVTPVDIGAARVGIGSLSGNLSVTNTAANDGFSENLNAAISGSSGQITGSSGNVVALAPQQTNSNTLNVTLDSSTAGAKSGIATVQFQSNGIGLDGGAPINNGSQGVTVNGKVYTPAVANVLTSSPVDFGIVHVGDSGATTVKSVGIQNGATAIALNDVLIGTISAGGTSFSGSGNLGAGLGPQASSSALQVNLDTATAGIFTGTADLALASHDADLADLPLTTSPLSLKGQVNRYAALDFLDQGGQGNLSGNASSGFTLDFGSVLQNAAAAALLAFFNDNPLADQAFTDLLSSTGTITTGSGFMITGNSVAGLAGGTSQGGFDITFNTATLGNFLETLIFDVGSSNSSGYNQVIGHVAFTIEGSVVSSVPSVPEPATLTVLSSALGMLFFVHRRRRMR